jgi:hypothetical protein
VKLQDESNFEMVHDGLTTFASTVDRSQPFITEQTADLSKYSDPTTNDSTVKKSIKHGSSVGGSVINKEMADLNKSVWRPWWKTYLERCD